MNAKCLSRVSGLCNAGRSTLISGTSPSGGGGWVTVITYLYTTYTHCAVGCVSYWICQLETCGML